MSSNNVIMFPPRNNKYNGPDTIEEVDESMEMVKQFHIQETIETIVPFFFNQLSVAGFNSDDEDDDILKHSAMVVEAIRSLLCAMRGIEHPLQLIAENLFVQTPEGLEVSDKIKIIITPSDKEGKSE